MEANGVATPGGVSGLAIIPALPTNVDTGIHMPGNDDVCPQSIDLEASTADLQELLGDALLELKHLRCKDGLSAKTISLLEWRLQVSEKEADVGLGALQRASEQAVHCLELELARHEYELSGLRLEVSSQRQHLALLEKNAQDALEDVATAARTCQIFFNECDAQRAKHGLSKALACRAQAELATSYVELGHSRERELALKGEVQELHTRVEQQMGDVARLEERSEQAKVQAEAARNELEHRSAEAEQQLEVFKQRAELAERLAANTRAHLTSLEAGIHEREAALLKRLQLAEEDQTLATTTVEERLRTASQHAQEMEKDLRKQMQDVLDKLALERDSWSQAERALLESKGDLQRKLNATMEDINVLRHQLELKDKRINRLEEACRHSSVPPSPKRMTAALDAITSLVDHLAPPTTTQKPNHRPVDTRLGLADLLGPAQGALPSQHRNNLQNAGSPVIPPQATGLLHPLGDQQVPNPSGPLQGALSSGGEGTGRGDKHDAHAQGKGQAALVPSEHGPDKNQDAAPPKGREKRKARGPSGGKSEKGLANVEPPHGRAKRRKGDDEAGLNAGEAEPIHGEGSGSGKGGSADMQERLPHLLATTTSAVVSGGSSQGQSQRQSLAVMSPPEGGEGNPSEDASGQEQLPYEDRPGPAAREEGGSGSRRSKGKSRQPAPKRSSLPRNTQGVKVAVQGAAPGQDAGAPSRPSRNRKPPQAFWVGGSAQAPTSEHSPDLQEAASVEEGKHSVPLPPSSSATDPASHAKKLTTANQSGAGDADGAGKSNGERGAVSHSSSGGEHKSYGKGPGPRQGAERMGGTPQEQGAPQVKSKPPRKSRAANPGVQRGGVNKDAGTMAEPTGKVTVGKGIHGQVHAIADSSLLDARPEQGNDAGQDHAVTDPVSDPAHPDGVTGAGSSATDGEHAANVDPVAQGAADRKRKSGGKRASPTQPEARQSPAKGGRRSTGLQKKGVVPGVSEPASPDGAQPARDPPAEVQPGVQGPEGRASKKGRGSAAAEKTSKIGGAANRENEVPEGMARRPVRQRAHALPYWMGTAAARDASQSPSAVASPLSHRQAVNAKPGVDKPARQSNDAADKPAHPADPPLTGPLPSADVQAAKSASPGADVQGGKQAPAPRALLRRITKRPLRLDDDADAGDPADVKGARAAGATPKRMRAGKHAGTGAGEESGAGNPVEGAAEGLKPAGTTTNPAEVSAKAEAAIPGRPSPRRRKSGKHEGVVEQAGTALAAEAVSADGPQPHVGPSPRRPRRARAPAKAAGPSDVGNDMQPFAADGGATAQGLKAVFGVSDTNTQGALQREGDLGGQPSSKPGGHVEEARGPAADGRIGSGASLDGPVENEARGSGGNAEAQPTNKAPLTVDGNRGPLGRRHVSKIDLNTLWDFDFLDPPAGKGEKTGTSLPQARAGDKENFTSQAGSKLGDEASAASNPHPLGLDDKVLEAAAARVVASNASFIKGEMHYSGARASMDKGAKRKLLPLTQQPILDVAPMSILLAGSKSSGFVLPRLLNRKSA